MRLPPSHSRGPTIVAQVFSAVSVLGALVYCVHVNGDIGRQNLLPLLACVSVVPHVAGSLQRLHRRAQIESLNDDRLAVTSRPSRVYVVRSWLLILAEVVFLWLTWRAGVWTLREIGLDLDPRFALAALAAGFALYTPFVLVTEAFTRKPRRQSGAAYYRLAARSWIDSFRAQFPRGQFWNAAYSARTLGPAAALEEVVYRGFFVVLLGGMSHSLIALVIGYILFVVIHLYHGVQVAFSLGPFYVIVAFLARSSLGLWASIGFHFAAHLEHRRTMTGLLPFVRLFHRAERFERAIRNRTSGPIV